MKRTLSVHQYFTQLPHEMQSYFKSYTSFAYRSVDWFLKFKIEVVKNGTFFSNCENPLRLHLIPYFKGRDIAEITTSDIQEYFNGKRGELSLETLSKHKSCLDAIFDIAVSDGLRERSPITKRIKIASDIELLRRSVWTLEQYKTAWRFAKRHRNGLDIMVLMETAITRSELLGLTWEDFDSQSACLRLRNGLVKSKNPYSGKLEIEHDGLKNKFREREIPLSKELNEYLALKPRYIKLNNAMFLTKHIFHAPKGGAYFPDNWYKRVLQSFMRNLHEEYPEIPALTTHELRHTRASLLVHEEEVGLFPVAQLMGHKDLRMLRERYIHPDTEALRRALGF